MTQEPAAPVNQLCRVHPETALARSVWLLLHLNILPGWQHHDNAMMSRPSGRPGLAKALSFKVPGELMASGGECDQRKGATPATTYRNGRPHMFVVQRRTTTPCMYPALLSMPCHYRVVAGPWQPNESKSPEASHA